MSQETNLCLEDMASDEVMEELEALMAILEEDTVEVLKEGNRPRVSLFRSGFLVSFWIWTRSSKVW